MTMSPGELQALINRLTGKPVKVADLPDREPPSTIAELRDVLIAYDASRPRSVQRELGPSELGTPCDQQIARKLTGAPTRPTTAPPWAPMQGTAMHVLMEDVLAYWNGRVGRDRWVPEAELQITPDVIGHGDAYDRDHALVVDWKHVGRTALQKLQRARRAGKPPSEQVSPEYRVQAHLYGLGHEMQGRPVRWVRLVLLARSWLYDDSDEWTERYDDEVAGQALERYQRIKTLNAGLDVPNNRDRITLIQASPTPDACKWCEFHRPGTPSDWSGCAGDTAAHARTVTRFADGLIPPSESFPAAPTPPAAPRVSDAGDHGWWHATGTPRHPNCPDCTAKAPTASTPSTTPNTNQEQEQPCPTQTIF